MVTLTAHSSVGSASTIEVLHRGEPVADSIQTAIGAGPNLVSFDASTGTSYVDIPSDDDNINILEHAANSAVGLVLSKKQVTLVVTVYYWFKNYCLTVRRMCGFYFLAVRRGDSAAGDHRRLRRVRSEGHHLRPQQQRLGLAHEGALRRCQSHVHGPGRVHDLVVSVK